MCRMCGLWRECLAKVTFGELHDSARRLDAALRDEGCGPGDTVALHLPNQYAAEIFIAFAAVTDNGK
jgi:acyl-CoA synthetase (AMP-forming)/AMP-acid ligase II